MMRHPFFVLYALSLLGFATYAQSNHWNVFSRVDELRVPKSVRDNPGIYRAIYQSHYRYSGGK